jgi:hypothetical protein
MKTIWGGLAVEKHLAASVRVAAELKLNRSIVTIAIGW